jgi:hypothetical protein
MATGRCHPESLVDLTLNFRSFDCVDNTHDAAPQFAIQARIAEWQRQHRDSDYGAVDFLSGSRKSRAEAVSMVRCGNSLIFARDHG